MRIATGGIIHETSTFVDTRTTLRNFEYHRGILRGEAMLECFRGTNVCTGGFIDGAGQHDFELVPLLRALAFPGGLIRRDDYESLKSELIERLQAAEPEGGLIDGVLLDLHGAMVVEGIDDGDGDLIEAVRNAVGPERPIVVTQDPHSNHTKRRVEAADALIGFDTFPHVDMAERGREAAEIIVRTVRGEIRPMMSIHQLPMFWSARCQVTAHPPMNEVIDRLHEVEKRSGIITATVATGFPWSDVPEVGSSVIVVADGSFDLAQQTGGGAPGDSTEVLRTFLDLQLQEALLLYMVDAAVAQQAHDVGAGRHLAVSLGGKSDPIQDPPVEVEAEVVALSDGKFAYDGPMFAGLTGNMGATAWLRVGGVSVVVVSAREQPYDPALARSLGINCTQMRYIALKSAAHFRAAFEPICGSIYNVDTAGIHTHDFKKLKQRKRTRAVFPVEIEPNGE